MHSVSASPCLALRCSMLSHGDDLSQAQAEVAIAQEEQDAMIQAFKPFFEDEGIKKVWHNYSFDRHVLGNHVRSHTRCCCFDD